MKLAIMIPSLNTGGAERTAVSLANWLARNKNIDVYLINPGKDDNNYIIDVNVNYFYNVNKISSIKFYFKTISFFFCFFSALEKNFLGLSSLSESCGFCLWEGFFF